MVNRNYRGNQSVRDISFPLAAIGSALAVMAVFIYLFAISIRFFSIFLGLLSVFFFALAALRYMAVKKIFPGFAGILYKILQICFIIWLISFIIVEALVIAGGKTDEGSEGSDYLIVLGAGINGMTPSLSLSSRLDTAAEYLRDNPDTLVIVTGGQGPGEDITEAEAMRTYLVAKGIDEANILMEPRAVDTLQNFKYSFGIIESGDIEDPKISVISNDFHLYRSRLISGYEGYDVTVINAPTPHLYLKITYIIREYFSLAKVFAHYVIYGI
ncbi:MAG: YdcF family protein [Oscillospiraceae bacterium]|nr:YdcF family protein [Oscillospiraceae bacterium]